MRWRGAWKGDAACDAANNGGSGDSSSKKCRNIQCQMFLSASSASVLRFGVSTTK